MIRYCIVLGMAMVSCLGIAPYAQCESTTTLGIVVWEPAPPTPITESDVIRLFTYTPEHVFRGSGHPEYSSTLVVDGFDIAWTISTSGFGGVSIPESSGMLCLTYLGPLTAGTYQVTATWTHTGDGLLVGAPSSGAGTMSFDVVPEPSTFAMLLAAVSAMLSVRRRH